MLYNINSAKKKGGVVLKTTENISMKKYYVQNKVCDDINIDAVQNWFKNQKFLQNINGARSVL